MISILIPTYNYSVFPLVENLYNQCEKASINYEIIVLDDASSDKEIVQKNLGINSLQHCSFEILPKNIGRSKIRNLLAAKAKYEWLLFLDADTFPSNSDFVQRYLETFSNDNCVAFGGIEYPEKTSKNFSLRHKYGSERESLSLQKRIINPYRSFITMGFAIKKEVFEKIRFNENLVGYGYEDSVFGFELQKKNIPLLQINNPVIHLNLETNKEFIKKSELALQNLLDFYEDGVIERNSVKILKTYLRLKNLNLLFVAKLIFNVSKKKMLNNLNSSNPSLFLFDLYRLGYLSSLKIKNA